MDLKTMRYPLCALAISLVAAYPWLVGLSYSKGNDFFYWVHFAWLTGPELLRGGLPDWTMLSGCGQPVFNLDHIPDAILQGVLTLVLGLEGGIRGTIVLCFAVGGLGTYVLARDLVGWRRAALVAVLAYMASWNMTRTADFYVYTSNVFQYVLLPWVVLCLRRACAGGLLGWHLGAAALIAVCAMANPQTAIKVVVFAGGWVVLERGLSGGWVVIRRLGAVGLATAWLAASHIAIALLHRTELYTFGKRGSAVPRSLTELFYVPIYAFDWMVEAMGGPSLANIPLGRLVDSPHLGLAVVAVSLCAVGYRGQRAKQARLAWGLGGFFLFGYFASSWTNPTEWIGAPRKMFFAVAFCASLLAAFGMRRLVAWGRLRGYGRQGLYWAGLALIGVELLGLKSVLYAQGSHRVPLAEIPQVRYWQSIAADQTWNEGDRFYTFQPDLAFMLYPALVGRPVANRIHQRDYTAEFFSYQDTLNRILLTAPDQWPRVSEYLALANIRYIDLPRDGFSGRFRPGYAGLTAHFAADGGLREIGRRFAGPADAVWFRHARGGSGQDGLVQVAYENTRARLAFVPQRTFAIIGDPRRGEKLFEEIALRSDFDADAFVFLLCDDVASLDGLSIDGFVKVDGGGDGLPDVREWTLDELVALYGELPAPIQLAQPVLAEYGSERLVFDLAAGAESRFLFVSLQRFTDWHAYDESGRRLPTFKTGGGLTALFVPAESHQVELRYERPAYKGGWRAFSLAGWVLVLGALSLRRVRRLRI